MRFVHFSPALTAAAIACQLPSVSAQSLTAPLGTDVPGHSVVDAQGMFPTDPGSLIFRNGTDPLVPITRTSGEQLTWGEFNQVGGEIQISPRPGGGTDVSIDLTGLIPGEFYSIWSGYWAEPGFPSGPRIAFGAVTEAGDGSDNFGIANAGGTLSFDLVQQEGPMTVHGSAPTFAALTPAFDSDGAPQSHTGYAIGIAYHFGDYPDPPYLGPGPPGTWALQGTAFFAPVPEPSSIVLSVLAVGCCVVVRLRRCGK